MKKNSQHPLVTVLMPVYNAGAYLPDAIESILNQSLLDFELLIINDGSQDDSLSIIREYEKKDSRIRVISHEGNSGQVVAINEGIELARGVFIARMDADDISMPDRLEKQHNFLLQHKKAIVGCFTRPLYEGNRLGDINPRPTTNINLRLFLGYGCSLAGGTIMAPKELLLKQEFKPEYWLAEDYYYWAQVAMREEAVELCLLPEVLYLYRTNMQSVTSTNKTLQIKMTTEIGNQYRQAYLKKGGKTINASIHRGWLFDVLKLKTVSEREELMHIYYTLQALFVKDQQHEGKALKAIVHKMKLYCLTVTYNRGDLPLMQREVGN